MKHLHSKQNLAISVDENLDPQSKYDAHSIIVKTGEEYSFTFQNIDYLAEGLPNLKQGFKIWMNRCGIRVNGNTITTKRLVFWQSNDDKKKVSGDHTHIYISGGASVTILETQEDNPNIGIFNVWANDNLKCYEFCDKSWIKTRKTNDSWEIEGHHDWESRDIATVRLVLRKTSFR